MNQPIGCSLFLQKPFIQLILSHLLLSDKPWLTAVFPLVPKNVEGHGKMLEEMLVSEA